MMKKWNSLFCIGIGILLWLVITIFMSTSAKASPLQCTNQQPYADSPYNICTGYGIACPRYICAWTPGTPGRFDTNGDYTPRRG